MSRNFSAPTLAVGLLLLGILGCRSTNQLKAPSWTKVKVLSGGEDHPSKIISDDNDVYFVADGTIASQNEGTNNIKRVSLKDGSVTVLVKGGEAIPDAALAVDDRFLYWSGNGNIMRVPKSGGASEKIIPHAPEPSDIVLDRDNIYWVIWTGEGSPPQPIMFAPKNAGLAKQLTPPQSPTSGICLDGEFVYWMTGEGIKKTPRTGGPITDVYRNQSKWPSLGLAQDVENFYFCQMDPQGHSTLMRLNKKSGEVTQLAASINHAMEFVVDEANVYYFDNVLGQGSFGPVAIVKVSKKGGKPVEVDQGEAGWVKYLAVDSKQVYFTDISKVYAMTK